MPDEELGRAWCRATGRAPLADDDGTAVWWTDDLVAADPGLPASCGLPPPLWPAITGRCGEGEAYAAVGAALRAVLALADEVRKAVATP